MYWLRMLKNVTTWMSLLISDLLTSQTVKHIIHEKLIWKNPSSRNPYRIHMNSIENSSNFPFAGVKHDDFHIALCTKSVPQIPRSAEVATSSCFDATSMGTFTSNHGQMINRVDMNGLVTDIYIYNGFPCRYIISSLDIMSISYIMGFHVDFFYFI